MGKVCQSLLIHQVINYLPFGQGIFIAHDAKAKIPPATLDANLRVWHTSSLTRSRPLFTQKPSRRCKEPASNENLDQMLPANSPLDTPY